jgi:hypothetical protein
MGAFNSLQIKNAKGNQNMQQFQKRYSTTR